MLGMNLLSFLVLLVVSIVVAVVFHFLVRYRFIAGIEGLLGKIAVGWLGGWLGSPVIGHWGFKVESIYIIPALLGAIVADFVCVLFWKALSRACATKSTL